MTKRFIAGAVCPECKMQDKIRVDSEAGTRECVNCGFTDERPVEGVQEPLTRVTRPAARRVETEATPVTLIDPADPDLGRGEDD